MFPFAKPLDGDSLGQVVDPLCIIRNALLDAGLSRGWACDVEVTYSQRCDFLAQVDAMFRCILLLALEEL